MPSRSASLCQTRLAGKQRAWEHDWSRGHYQVHGSKMTHTEIIRDDGKQLPITDSGYRSHFMDSTHLDKYNGILDYVTRWLDHQAQSKKWKAYVADQEQLKLF